MSSWKKIDFCIKYKADETIKIYKVCLVILGNTQTEGRDFTETVAHITKMVMLRRLLSIASARNWYVHQMTLTMPPFVVISLRKSICIHLLSSKGPQNLFSNSLLYCICVISLNLVLIIHSLLTTHCEVFLCVLMYVNDLF